MKWWAGAAVAVAIGAALLLGGGYGAFKRWAYAPGDRDEWQQPEKVIAALEIRPGSHVADLGAGGGYFTFRLADAAGADGRVYAVDIDPDMLGYLTDRSEKEGYRQVTVVEATPDDAKLPPASVDLILMTNTYHHISDRVAYFSRLREDLRPGGRVAIIEFDGGGFFGHWTEPAEIEAELIRAGYTLAERHDFLERQSFQIFGVSP